MPIARGRVAFRTNVLLTLGAYAFQYVFLILATPKGVETCAPCVLTPLASFVTSALAIIALMRAHELRVLLRWGHAALATWMWVLYGFTGILFASEPKDFGGALGLAFVAFGMFLGLFIVVPGYLAWVWLTLRLWPKPPAAPIERVPPPVEIGPVPAKRKTTFELVRQK